MRRSRRAFLTGLTSCLLAPEAWAKVNEAAPPSAEDGAESSFLQHELHFANSSRSMRRARVYVPKNLSSDRAWPVAILLHGYAQALVDDRGIAAWRAEYDVLEAYRELQGAHVEPTPALGKERAEQIVRQLAKNPFSGMVLVTPLTPIPYFQRDLGRTLERYTDWIHEDLLPKVAEFAPISTAPEHIGLAGVSMGGLVGLELMCRFPDRYGAFCGMQIAIKRAQASRYAWLLHKAFDSLDSEHGRPIRVVTATQDTYRWSNQAFYHALVRQKLDASLQLRKGAHTSRWMRQAGSLESLLWLDQTLNHTALPEPAPAVTPGSDVAQGPALTTPQSQVEPATATD